MGRRNNDPYHVYNWYWHLYYFSTIQYCLAIVSREISTWLQDISLHTGWLSAFQNITWNRHYLMYLGPWLPLLRPGVHSVCDVWHGTSAQMPWSTKGTRRAWCCYVCSCVPRSDCVAWNPGRTLHTCIWTVPGAADDVAGSLHMCWTVSDKTNSDNHGHVRSALVSCAGTTANFSYQWEKERTFTWMASRIIYRNGRTDILVHQDLMIHSYTVKTCIYRPP